MQTIGQRLEDARKAKGVSIREAAEATKIRGDYLQKFENNHFDIGLNELYTRGFLRTYSNYLKLPADRILNDYAALGRGEGRSSRQSTRDNYGRMEISTALTSEPADRASSDDEAAPTAEPRTARTARPRTGTSLPTGPDPAVVFKWVKWGAPALVVAIIALVIWAMRDRSPSSHSSSNMPTAATTPVNTAPVNAAPPPTATVEQLVLVANDVVHVIVSRKNPSDDLDGEELFRGILAKGQRQVVPKLGPVWITVTAAENLVIHYQGRVIPIHWNGELQRGRQRFDMK